MKAIAGVFSQHTIEGLNNPNSLRGVERFSGINTSLHSKVCLNNPNSLRGVERIFLSFAEAIEFLVSIILIPSGELKVPNDVPVDSGNGVCLNNPNSLRGVES